MWLISRWWRLENYQKKVTFYLVADHTIICVISPLLCSRLTPLMMSPIMATQWQMEVKLHPHTSLVFLKRSIQCGWDGQQNVIYWLLHQKKYKLWQLTSPLLLLLVHHSRVDIPMLPAKCEAEQMPYFILSPINILYRKSEEQFIWKKSEAWSSCISHLWRARCVKKSSSFVKGWG